MRGTPLPIRHVLDAVHERRQHVQREMTGTRRPVLVLNPQEARRIWNDPESMGRHDGGEVPAHARKIDVEDEKIVVFVPRKWRSQARCSQQ